jgi:hypothetical protein
METPDAKAEIKPRRSKPDHTTLILRYIIATILGLIALGAFWYIYAYASSPEPIRHPTSTHYHFRLQIINNGTPVNFADAAYQTQFSKDVCSAKLTKEPFHFHDNLDQFVHVHWDHLTGGLLLKQYGWNFLGGPDDTLGYQFEHPLQPVRIPIHGRALPLPPRDAHYYIYTGDADSYQERNWNDFLHQDLRNFFTANAASVGFWDRLIPPAFAHGDDEKLTALNDVLGNVVIFAQKDHPTTAQIKDRFNHLVPLPESSCGG